MQTFHSNVWVTYYFLPSIFCFEQATFLYDSALWTNRTAYNVPGGSSLDASEETKLPTYWETPFSRICLGMTAEGQTNYLAINYTADSLYSLIADGQYRATTLGRDTWKALISGSSLQRNCNKEGFNASIGQNEATHPGPPGAVGAKFESQLGGPRAKQ